MVKKAAIGVVAFLLVVVFLLAKDWDSPELGQTLLAKVTEATGVEIAAEGFSLNLLGGLTLENVSGSSISETRDLTFSLDRLVFEHRVLPLLSGTVAVDRVVLESPVIELVESAEASASKSDKAETSDDDESSETAADAPAGSGEDEGGGLTLDVQEIRIENATLVLKKKGESGETRIEGLDFEMDDLTVDPAAGSLAGIAAAGRLSVEQATFDTLRVTETESQFTLAEAQFEMSELTFRTPQGAFEAQMTVDFNPVPFSYTLEAQGDPLDVNSLLGATEGFGPGHVQLKADGAGAESKDVVGDGGLQLTEGTFPETAVFSGIDKAVGKNVIAGMPYEATEATFHLENGRLILAPFRFKSENARLDLSGWVDLDGPMELKVALATPREGVQIDGVGSNALDVLADEEGWVPVPISITGTMEEPTVRPDGRALAAQARKGATREATERATGALKGLIRRRN